MVDIRCTGFDDAVWGYVVENARMRKMPRSKALEQIVKEHMRFMAEAQQKKMEESLRAQEKER